ncbi:hypothetical protein CW714_07350, partial [Methanophagales archaeon]
MAKEGKLIEIEREVSSKYEVADIYVELERKGNKLPVLFHSVDGMQNVKVIMNVVGGRQILAE